jgi:hypothetical protein
LVFLTLLPAVRRGSEYVRDNGSPWRWPLYPWVLFGLLGFAVPARAFLLCWSMHLLDSGDRDRLIFGPYFLVPFGLAVVILLLEIGIASKKRGPIQAALATPILLILLALVGHRNDSVYRGFLGIFASRLGGDPLWATLLALVGFYAYAALRHIPLATEGLTLVLVALAFAGPDALTRHSGAPPLLLPLLAAGALQLTLGMLRRDERRCLLGIGGLAAAALATPAEPGGLFRAAIAFHLALASILAVGAAFDDNFGRRLRTIGAALVLPAFLVALFGKFDFPANVPSWCVAVYPALIAGLLAGYGVLLRHRFSMGVAAICLCCWLALVSWRAYSWLRQLVAGLDHIALSLALFALAVVISLAKSGVLARRLATWRGAPSRVGSREAVGLSAQQAEWQQAVLREEDRISLGDTADDQHPAMPEQS